VGVHQVDAAFAQQRRGAQHGPRIPRAHAQLGHRHTQPAQRADLSGVGRGGERHDQHLETAFRPDPADPGRQVDQPDLGAAGMQGRDEVGDLHGHSDA
jgi:hypothetical protein